MGGDPHLPSASPGTSLPGSKTNKSCDECRSRKVRCPDPSSRGPCKNCVRRKTKCNFGLRKPAHRRNVAEQFLPKNLTSSLNGTPHTKLSRDRESGIGTPRQTSPLVEIDQQHGQDSNESHIRKHAIQGHCIPDLFVDHLLSRAQNPNISSPEERPGGRGNGIIGSYRLTFFSDARLASLSNLLGNNKVNELVGRISGVIHTRVDNRPSHGHKSAFPVTERGQTPVFSTDRALAAKYIQLYFERVNGIFPFLDRTNFERNTRSDRTTAINKPWLCLYHTVLALGCQYDDGGSFEPGAGKSWKLFAVALEGLPDLLLQPDSIETLQAMTAMAIYSLGVSCMALEHVIISEAARRAQNLAGATFTGSAALSYQRAFWVLYAIEKLASFHMGRSSVFVDGDIACPVPHIPESTISGLDWFLTLLRYARIVSKALTSLFCVGVANKPSAYHLGVTRQLTAELEAWRLSIPDNGLRPGGRIRPEFFYGPVQKYLTVFVHYLHNNMLLVMSLTSLHYLQKAREGDVKSQKQGAAATILDTSRKILEMTTLIEIEPRTNVWVLAIIPVTALFVLFDIVVHNPYQPEAPSNLALLDVAAGHFSHIEYRSRGSLPGSLISEFAHIARNYLNNIQRGVRWHQEQTILDPVPSSAVSSQQRTRSTGLIQKNLDMPMDSSVNGISASAQLEQVHAFDWLADGFESHLAGDGSMGTNILDLFSTALPDLDPMFYPE